MAESIQIEKCMIEPDSGVLELHLTGSLPFMVQEKKIRLSAVFQAEHVDRYYPLPARCVGQDSDRTLFEAKAKIQLDSVFFEYIPGPEEQDITLRFQVCSPQKEWFSFGETLELPQKYFVSKPVSASWIQKGMRRVLYVICTFLLPVWLFQGYLALKGHGTLHPAARNMQGKKALLYHAHGLVSGWTGYGYSIREIKTNYFCRKYQKFCQKYPETEGILFLSERRVEKGGNLDLVRECLRQSEQCNKKHIVLREFLETRPVHKLKWSELRKCAELTARSRVIVLEDFYPQLHALQMRKETRLLQMWHACGAFKLFGLSELGIVGNLPQDTRNHRNYDAALASSAGIVPFYSEAFGIPISHVKPIGVPRTDSFFDASYGDQIREILYERYPVCKGRKVVLFAPTFRGSGNKTAFFPVSRFPVDQIMEKLSEDTILIVKNHPFVKEAFAVSELYQERVLDLSEGENINDLLWITTVLITDYSSSVFEASLLRIPMLFYVFDLEEYLEERDLYFDFASFVPGRIVKEIPELIAALQEALQKPEAVRIDHTAFQQFFLGALDGHSTERTVQLIGQLYEEAGIS